jgi:hypothetical protein
LSNSTTLYYYRARKANKARGESEKFVKKYILEIFDKIGAAVDNLLSLYYNIKQSKKLFLRGKELNALCIKS